MSAGSCVLVKTDSISNSRSCHNVSAQNLLVSGRRSTQVKSNGANCGFRSTLMYRND